MNGKGNDPKLVAFENEKKKRQEHIQQLSKEEREYRRYFSDYWEELCQEHSFLRVLAHPQTSQAAEDLYNQLRLQQPDLKSLDERKLKWLDTANAIKVKMRAEEKVLAGMTTPEATKEAAHDDGYAAHKEEEKKDKETEGESSKPQNPSSDAEKIKSTATKPRDEVKPAVPDALVTAATVVASSEILEANAVAEEQASDSQLQADARIVEQEQLLKQESEQIEDEYHQQQSVLRLEELQEKDRQQKFDSEESTRESIERQRLQAEDIQKQRKQTAIQARAEEEASRASFLAKEQAAYDQARQDEITRRRSYDEAHKRAEGKIPPEQLAQADRDESQRRSKAESDLRSREDFINTRGRRARQAKEAMAQPSSFLQTGEQNRESELFRSRKRERQDTEARRRQAQATALESKKKELERLYAEKKAALSAKLSAVEKQKAAILPPTATPVMGPSIPSVVLAGQSFQPEQPSYTTSIQEETVQTEVPSISSMRKPIYPAGGVSQTPQNPTQVPQNQQNSQPPPPKPPNRRSNPINSARNAIQAVQKAVETVRKIQQLRTRLTIIGILLVIFFIFVLIALIFGQGDGQGDRSEGIIPVSINKSVDKDTVLNSPDNAPGENITYTIDVSYPGNATDVLVTDPLPEGSVYVDSSPKGKTLDNQDKETTDKDKVTKVVWSLKDIQKSPSDDASDKPQTSPPPEISSTPETKGLDFTKYTQSPISFPPPSGESDVAYDEETIDRANSIGGYVAKHQPYLIATVTNPTFVDPFLAVIWMIAIEGTAGDPYAWNCNDDASRNNVLGSNLKTLNDPCGEFFSSGDWQVNGIQPSQAYKHLADDFNEVYGSTDAGKVKEVITRVMEGGNMSNPSTIPTWSVEEIVSKAGEPGTSPTPEELTARHLVGILLMDMELGAVAMSREVAGDIGTTGDWVASMQGYGYSEFALWSNRAKYLADHYTGKGSGGAGGNKFTKQNLQLTVQARSGLENTYLVNQATALVIGGGGSENPRQASDPSSILAQAELITEALEPGFWGFYNRLLTLIRNNESGYTATERTGATDKETVQLTKDGLYWCTFLVIDAYNLAGITGLVPESHLAVMNMIPYFKEHYTYLDYDREDHKTILQQVKPGDAFFMMDHADDEGHNGHEHTGIVQSLTIDEKSGFGQLVTYESNSDKTTHTFPIVGWDIQETFYPMRGFGGK